MWFYVCQPRVVDACFAQLMNRRDQLRVCETPQIIVLAVVDNFDFMPHHIFLAHEI